MRKDVSRDTDFAGDTDSESIFAAEVLPLQIVTLRAQPGNPAQCSGFAIREYLWLILDIAQEASGLE